MAKRVYPHVDSIADWKTQQTIRLLWDKLFDLEAAHSATLGDLRTAQTTITQLQGDVTTAHRIAKQASLAVGGAVPARTGGGSGGTGTGFVDDGLGAQGCAAAGGTGHPGAGLPLDATTAGKIVCGTGNEWPALKAATVDLPTRETNAVELLRRMIWHLQQYGYTAGRQRNPSGLVSKDKLTVYIGGTARAYDVFQAYDDFANPLVTHMIGIGGANYVADSGVAD